MKGSRLLSLDPSGGKNWMLDVPPASIVNLDTSLHSCIAWGWSEACVLHDLAFGLSEITASESPLLFDASIALLVDRLRALVVMLEHAGEISANAERQSVQNAARR